MNLVNLLISNGYKPFRKIYQNDKHEYIECNKNDYFSSCVAGHTDIRLIKGDIEVVYGLHEAHMPPTLIYPIPKIKVELKDGGFLEGKNSDRAVNMFLSKSENLLEDIFSDKTFTYKEF